ncbi:calcium-binding protein [Fuscibacter oryzae]|uniref:Calcium-binding protein n=1 Tax=Fuscibacter oryzae TaxID=2803939 RepID=A0A8J7SR08_9RHOB|nr:calcium-binding protein [Fuscibacter oryzae]MBL4927216.1 hypothetical protein [Fuscibacter oryzae]
MQLQTITTYGADTLGTAFVADGLGVVQTGGYLRLIFASRTDSRPGQLTLTQAASSGSDLQPGSDIAVQDANGTARLYLFTTMGDMLRTTTLNGNGKLSGSPGATTTEGTLIGVIAMEVIERAGGDLAVLSQKGIAGLRMFGLSDGGALTLIGSVQDEVKSHVDTVSDMVKLTVGASDFLLALSPTENGVTVYHVGATGLELNDAMGPYDGLAINGPVAAEVVQVGGQTFAIVASTGSSSLTALRINPLGVLFQTDHLVDDRDTRFAHVAALDQFSAQGRVFIVAGGTDAGLSVIEVLPGGELSKVLNVPLETGPGLAAVTGISVAVYQGMANIFATDARGDRILHYGIDLSTLGPLIQGAGTLTGTSADDRLIGSAGADTLFGGAGDDFLHDGAGSDHITGGAGADTFVMASDGQVDYIHDFQQGLDHIDLSDWGRIYSAASLTITATATGAVISYGEERLEIASSSGLALSLTDADFLF